MFEDFSFCLSCEQYDRDKRWCKLLSRPMVCGCSYGEDKPRNNFELLKAMSMEQMAVWLAAMLGVNPFEGTGNEYNKWLNWLKEEVDE